MKKLELNQMENLDGGKFWGSSETAIGDCGPQGQLMVHTYRAFWTVIDAYTDYYYVPC